VDRARHSVDLRRKKVCAFRAIFEQLFAQVLIEVALPLAEFHSPRLIKRLEAFGHEFFPETAIDFRARRARPNHIGDPCQVAFKLKFPTSKISPTLPLGRLATCRPPNFACHIGRVSNQGTFDQRMVAATLDVLR
jgi:hypothetical protein